MGCTVKMQQRWKISPDQGYWRARTPTPGCPLLKGGLKQCRRRLMLNAPRFCVPQGKCFDTVLLPCTEPVRSTRTELRQSDGLRGREGDGSIAPHLRRHKLTSSKLGGPAARIPYHLRLGVLGSPHWGEKEVGLEYVLYSSKGHLGMHLNRPPMGVHTVLYSRDFQVCHTSPVSRTVVGPLR